MRHERPEEWAFFAPYWASLPTQGGVGSKYVFREEHEPLLQDTQVVSCCAGQPRPVPAPAHDEAGACRLHGRLCESSQQGVPALTEVRLHGARGPSEPGAMHCLDGAAVLLGQAEFMEHMRDHLREMFQHSGSKGGVADLPVALEEFEHFTALVRRPVQVGQDCLYFTCCTALTQ